MLCRYGSYEIRAGAGEEGNLYPPLGILTHLTGVCQWKGWDTIPLH